MTSDTAMMRIKVTLRLMAAIMLVGAWCGLTYAASSTISAVVPWQGQGEIFPIGTDKLRFLGSIEGIMYVETAEGEMDEAFVRCPIIQDIDTTNQTSCKGRFYNSVRIC